MELPFGVYNTSLSQDLAVVRTRAQWVLVVLALAALFVLPTVAGGEWLTWMTLVGTLAVAALGLHVMIGLSGQFSMAQAALMALGAYTAGVLANSHGLPAWATLPLAGLIAGIIGACFAIPAVRIHGFYLVMVTMAAQFVIDWAIKHISWTGGSYGLTMQRLVFFGRPVTDVQYCWIVLAVLVISIYLVKNIQRTNIGRRLVAMRDNEVAAEVMGVNLLWTKVLAFFIGSFFAGIAGWLWAYNNGILFLHPQQFDFMLSMKLLGMLVVGGMGSTSGAIMGVVFLQLADKLTDNINSILGSILPDDLAKNLGPSMALMIFALIVILFIMLEPRGIYGRVMRIRLWLTMHPFSF